MRRIKEKKYIIALLLLLSTGMMLLGGTGRPKDGFLSFVVVLGFLIIVLGILQLVDSAKGRMKKFLSEIDEAILP